MGIRTMVAETKMYDLKEGDKVVLSDTNTLQHLTIFFQYIDGRHRGVWNIGGFEFEGNLYGLFHWNASQKYYFYERDKDE